MKYMRDYHSRAWRLALLLFLAGFCSPADGQRNPTLSFDGMVDDFLAISGPPAIIHLMNGAMLDDVEILSFSKDRRTGGVRVLQYKDGSRKVSKKSPDIYRMMIGGRPYQFRFHGPTKSYFLIDTQQALQQAEGRLAVQKSTLRKPISDDESAAAVVAQKQFLVEAITTIGASNLTQFESNFCVLLTDFPEPTARRIAGYVDQVCQHLNGLFGMPIQTNIWHGKVVVAAFSQQPLYGAFQSKVMGNDNYGNNTIDYNTKRDKFVVAVRNKDASKVLARRLVWAIGGGYITRYRSNAKIPEWLQTGMREHVTEQLYPKPGEIQKELKSVSNHLRETGSLRGTLSAKVIQHDRRRLTGVLVAFLVAQNPHSFGQFFEDVKLGVPWEDALQINYGATTDQFVNSFGGKLGIRNLTQ